MSKNKIEEIKNYTEKFEIFYEPYRNQEINTPDIFKYPKIPHIINLKKQYPGFIIELDENCEKIVLMNKGSKKCTLILNYNYFSPKEILDKFNIISINSFQQIGSIIHLNLEKEHEKHIIAQVLLDKVKNAKTVITKTNKINNIYRNIDYEVLAGEPNLITTHYENGLKFYIDYGKVYWNSKLENERTNFINELKGSSLCDPFCGAGPMVLYGLKKGLNVYCNDLNPDAIECVKRNLILNKKHIKGECYLSNIDAAIYLEKIISNKIDNFVFNLPEFSLDYIQCLDKMEHQFTIYCYYFAKDEADALIKAKEKSFFNIKQSDLKFIRKVSPGKCMFRLTKTINKIF